MDFGRERWSTAASLSIEQPPALAADATGYAF
jgi:hypothetical protein